MTNKKELLIAELDSMDTYSQFDKLCELWNEYASENESDSMIYDSVEDLADLGVGGVELARMVFFGDLKNWNDKITLNGYGNVVSVWNVENSPIRLEDLADWLLETDHCSVKFQALIIPKN